MSGMAGVFIVALQLLCAGASEVGEKLVGRPAPLFRLRDLNGNEVSPADSRGRVVILHFWATWCPVCREEMPVLQEVSRRHADRVVVLGINLGERRKVVAAYVKESSLEFPILLDARGKVAATYGVASLPVTVVLGREGRVVAVLAMGALVRDLEGVLADAIGSPGG